MHRDMLQAQANERKEERKFQLKMARMQLQTMGGGMAGNFQAQPWNGGLGMGMGMGMGTGMGTPVGMVMDNGNEASISSPSQPGTSSSSLLDELWRE